MPGLAVFPVVSFEVSAIPAHDAAFMIFHYETALASEGIRQTPPLALHRDELYQLAHRILAAVQTLDAMRSGSPGRQNN